MREQIIIVEPFELIDILQCSGKVGANRHGYMTVSGHINADKEEEYMGLLLKETWASVKACSESGQYEILFSGVVTEGDITVENGLKTLTITIKTGSFLMDLDEHIRTFQNKSESYEKIVGTLTKDYPANGYIMFKGEGKSIGKLLCQYQETDWQFAKRLASYCNSVLIPNYISGGVKIYFGFPAGDYRGIINPTEYSINQSTNGLSYSVKLREIYNIGDSVTFQNQKCHVISRHTELEAGEMYHVYELMVSEMAKQDFLYNDKLIGVSLSATVTNVETTNVQVSITEDENKAASGQQWLPYATVYSSLNGTGWYCMPEVGDRVRVYFPSNMENEAYVLHSVHMASTNIEERVNPDYKSFMNKQGKEILFKPDSILITNNAGMALELSDDEGISLSSDKKITIQSNEAIEISSVNERVDLIAPKQIILQQGDTQMRLSDNLTMRGAKIRLD